MSKIAILFPLIIPFLISSCHTIKSKEEQISGALTKDEIIQDLDFIDQYVQEYSQLKDLKAIIKQKISN